MTSDLAHIVKVYWSLLLGNIVEWYEFALYGYLERFLEVKFFRGSAVAAWIGFGVTFFARPLGGTVCGAVADRWGRSVAVNLSIIGMLVGTCGQGCLPTYASGETAGHVGLSILIALRLLQGLSAAGEISTISTYLVEVGRRESLGMSMSLISVTCAAGFLSAKGVSFLTGCILGESRVADWAWRVPFLLAAFPGLIAVWGRRRMPESAAFLREKAAAEEKQQKAAEEKPQEQAVRTSLRDIVRAHAPGMLVAFGGTAAAGALCYGGFVWTNTYLIKRGLSHEGAMLASLVGRVTMMVLALPVGWLTDRQGVAWVLFVASAAMAVGGLPLFYILEADPTSVPAAIAVIGAGYGILGALSGNFFLYVVELFPVAVRGRAMGLSYNVGLAIFGGLSPAIAQASLGVWKLGPGIVLSVGGLVTACTVTGSLLMERAGLVTLAHVRPYPYFGSCRLRDCATGGEEKVAPVGEKKSRPSGASGDSALSEEQATGSGSASPVCSSEAGHGIVTEV